MGSNRISHSLERSIPYCVLVVALVVRGSRTLVTWQREREKCLRFGILDSPQDEACLPAAQTAGWWIERDSAEKGVRWVRV